MRLSQVWSEQDVVSDATQSAWQSQQYQCGTGNCACESGITTRAAASQLPWPLPVTSGPEWAEEIIPRRASNLYLTEVGGYSSAYNPQGRFGVAVLNDFVAQLLNLVDGQISLAGLAMQLSCSMAEVVEAIRLLEGAELVYTSPQEPGVTLSQSRNVAVWLHVTNQCNLRCTYCYIEKTPHSMSEETGRQALDEIFATTLRHQRGEVLLKFAGGEALTVFPLVQALTVYARQLGKRYGIAVQPIILTNGTPLNREIAQLMQAEDFVAAVSLDGLAQYNDITRPMRGGQGSFTRIERGLKLLLEYGVKFNVSVVVSKHNLSNLPALTRYLLERNLSFTFNFFRENELADNALNVENEQLIEWLGQAYAVIEESLPSYSLLNAILDRVQFNAPHLQACGVGTNYIVVKHTGEIVGCQMHMQKPAIGKLGQNKDLLELIAHSNFVAPAGRSVEQKEGCSQCQWRYVCAGGCPIMAFTSRGRYDSRSPFCATYQALIPQVLKLEAARIIKYGIKKPTTMQTY